MRKNKVAANGAAIGGLLVDCHKLQFDTKHDYLGSYGL
jgi:hypothetical protein